MSSRELTASARRKAAGTYLKTIRERAELNQAQMASALGMEWYTTVSAIETGRIQLSITHYPAWASSCRVDLRTLARNLTRHYEPLLYQYLFGSEKP